MSNNDEFSKNVLGGKTLNPQGFIYWLVFGIYALTVVFAEIMFLSILREVFPEGLTGQFAQLGAVMAGATAIALPLAKDRWIVPGAMLNAAYFFWFVDVVILTLNTLLAFEIATGLGNMFMWWINYSPASPIWAIVTWGVLMAIHPEHKRRMKAIKFQEEADDLFYDGMLQALNSNEVYQNILTGANEAARRYASRMVGTRLDVSKTLPGNGKPSEEIRNYNAETDGPKNR